MREIRRGACVLSMMTVLARWLRVYTVIFSLSDVVVGHVSDVILMTPVTPVYFVGEYAAKSENENYVITYLSCQKCGVIGWLAVSQLFVSFRHSLISGRRNVF